MEIPGLSSWLDCYRTLWEAGLVPDTHSRLLADGTVIVLSGETFHVYGPERRAWRFEVAGIADGAEHRTALRLPGRTFYSHFKLDDVDHRYWPVFDGAAIDLTAKDYDAPEAKPEPARSASTAALRNAVIAGLRALPVLAERSREAEASYAGDEHVARGGHRFRTAAREALAIASASSEKELAAVGREVAPLFDAVVRAP